jgi:type I restriction enzyme S subunit
MVREGDILITKDGTIGKTAFIKLLPEPATLASGIFLIRISSEKLDKDFLYQYFNSKYFKSVVESRIEGSVIPHLYQRDIEELFVPLPPLPEQRAIAHILSTLDDKIELNQKMNKTLEAIGQAIFKAWFVDFEPVRSKMEGRWKRGKSLPGLPSELYDLFPNRLVYNEELGKEIPEGWKVGKLGDVGKIQPGYAFKSKDFINNGIGLIKIKNIDKNGIVNLNFESFLPNEFINKIDEKYQLVSGDIIIAMTGAELGKVGIIPNVKKVFLLNQRVGKIVSNLKFFLYLFLIKKEIKELMKNISSASSAQGNISNSDIENIIILLPNNLRVFERFSELLFPLYERLVYNLGESLTLSSLRDALLPKLMSGKIRVPMGGENDKNKRKNQ